ncbi:MAG: cytochrome c [Proteobacteria bacterium]|nr:cytochrome c [Pseudomonadota bacterium]
MRSALALALLTIIAAAGAVAYANAAEPVVALKEAPGRAVTQGLCAVCHSLEYIPANAPAMDRGAWLKTVQKMRERYGAPIDDAQAREIVDYLSATYAGKR